MPHPEWESRNVVMRFITNITVEPTLFLYMMAFMTTSVIEQAFFIYKACRVDHGFNKTVCDNINSDEYKDLEKLVHITVSNFQFKYDIAAHAGQIVLALFMGAWSDKRGRKLPLLIGLVGKLYYSAMIVVAASQEHWPVDYVVYIATLPMAFTGADVAIFAAAYTYLVDVTSQESRTMRVTLLEVCYLATMPLGIALGSYLFTNVVHKSYAIMFSINVALMCLAIIYTFLRLEWQSNDRQRPLFEASNVFLDFFDYHHVINTGRAIGRKRPKHQRTYLIMLITMMGLYVFQRDEKDKNYMYVQEQFSWGVSEYSNFRTYLSALQDVILLTAVPFFSKVLGWRDTIIIMIGSLSHSTARIFYATAEVSWLFYVGGAFAAVGPIVAPVIRSMASKIVANSEKGKTFSVLSAADNAIPVVSGVLYSQLFNATIHTHPESIYYLTMATQMIVFIMVMCIHFKTKDVDLVHEDESLGKGYFKSENTAVN